MDKLLNLNPGEFKRLIPFFILYFNLYALLYLGDGISSSLFVMEAGIEKLPPYCALTAVVNSIFLLVYLFYIGKIPNLNIFKKIVGIILLNYFLSYAALKIFGNHTWCYGMFLISRDLAQTMIVVHFGNIIMDYFTRDELHRVLPITLAGGRMGGIFAGFIMHFLSKTIGTLNILSVYFLLGLFILIQLFLLGKLPFIQEAEEERKSITSYKEFFLSIYRIPFLFWFSIGTSMFFVTKFFLFFQYNNFFHSYFKSTDEMTSFIGMFTVIALSCSILVQLFFLNRLIAFIGLKGSFAIYNILLAISMFINIFPMTMFSAVFGRFLENELRVSYRSPLSQLITNKLDKSVRARARSWILGGVNPLSTFIASVVIMVLLAHNQLVIIGIIGFVCGLLYFVFTLKLFNYFEDKSTLVDFFRNRKEN